MEPQETLLQRVIDGEASEEEVAAFEAAAAKDPSLKDFAEGSGAVGALLREGLRSHAESVDMAPLWAGVQKEIAWHEAGRQRTLAAKAEAAGVSHPEPEVGWRSALARLFTWPTLATFAGAFLILLALPALLEQRGTEEPVARRVDPGPTELTVAALPMYEGVEVESVETSNAATVMVFQGGEGAATFIWVNENSSEEKAI